MKVEDILSHAEQIRVKIRILKNAARAKDTHFLESIARDIEAEAGTLVAAMQTEGIER